MDRRELRLSGRSGNNLGPLERFVEGIPEPLNFDLSKPRKLFEPFRRGIGDISKALACVKSHQFPALTGMGVKVHTPIDERRVSTSVLLTLLTLVRADRKTEEWSLSTLSLIIVGGLCSSFL